ncbi:Protein of uncharacterised function (DUF550) [Kluyvera cryocrescens]|nr:Protein of uncharacterised function (DUF550) [Kluyvera cryocrescens]
MTINLTDPANRLTAEQLVTLQLRIMSALSFCRQRPEKEARRMAELLELAGAAASELQGHQKDEEREKIRAAHAAWSDKAFGSVGPIGPLKHLSKEALEAVAEPGDLSEWADMQFLLWDAQRRAGITDEQITQAMVEKLAVNESRTWPEPKDGEPRFHVKSDAEKNGSDDE